MEKMLIVKLVRHGDRADLFARGHQYKDLTLFSISDLADVGIDYANLPEGAEVPVRFYAYFSESAKLNRVGRPYRDIERIEAVSQPATAISTDSTALLAELRAIRSLLQVMAQAQGLTLPELPTDPDQDPEPDGNGHNGHDQAEPQAEPLDAVFPRFQSGEAVPDAALPYYHEHVKAVGQAPADLEALRAWVKAHKSNGKH